MMLSTARSTASMALRGTNDAFLPNAAQAKTRTAKPLTAIVPYRTTQTAWISHSSSKPASAEPRTGKPGLVVPGPGAPPPAKKTRAEVPLPSQEGTKGAIQYAL